MNRQILVAGLLISTFSAFGQNYERRDEERRDDRREERHEERHVERVEVRRIERHDRDVYRGNVRVIPIEERGRYYGYRVPVRREIIWDMNLMRDFRLYYPEIGTWRYSEGYRIPAVPAYEASNQIGEVSNVYGRVAETYYDRDNDQYYLYFGEPYPNHIFSVIVPGMEARSINPRPDLYFNGQHVSITGYVTSFENRPEIIVRKSRQLEVY